MRNDPRGHSKYRRLAKQAIRGKACVWCGGPATQADHRIPVSIDPKAAKDPANLMPSCSRCNQSRGNRAAPKAVVAAPRSVFSTQRNHIPVLRQVSTHDPRRLTLRADYTAEVADARR